MTCSWLRTAQGDWLRYTGIRQPKEKIGNVFELAPLFGSSRRHWYLTGECGVAMASMAHQARADFCMLLGSHYLLIEGSGRWSLDALLSKSPQRRA